MQLKTQHGGTFLGFILGLVLGLGVALGVAIYVTKVPTPFSNKNQPRTNAQDVQETEKNKDWNPNSVLQPKAPAEPPVAPNASQPATEAPAAAADASKPVPRPTVTADPLGDLAKTKSGLSTSAAPPDPADPFDYIIQAGAYRTNADADAQQAKWAMLGLDAKISERDQSGRLVYRVRMGPFRDKNSAERIRLQLEANGIENILVRVQR
jgi:cell division protein FtsN